MPSPLATYLSNRRRSRERRRHRTIVYKGYFIDLQTGKQGIDRRSGRDRRKGDD